MLPEIGSRFAPVPLEAHGGNPKDGVNSVGRCQCNEEPVLTGRNGRNATEGLYQRRKSPDIENPGPCSPAGCPLNLPFPGSARARSVISR